MRVVIYHLKVLLLTLINVQIIILMHQGISLFLFVNNLKKTPTHQRKSNRNQASPKLEVKVNNKNSIKKKAVIILVIYLKNQRKISQKYRS